jgi:hypothetical protein
MILAVLAGATPAAAQTPSDGAARTPAVQLPTGPVLSEDEIRQRLQKEGYTHVTELRRQGPSYEAKAMRDGKPVNLTIDASTGSVRSAY